MSILARIQVAEQYWAQPLHAARLALAHSGNGAVSHLPDWLCLMPIFKNHRVIAWTAMFGHMTDIGGKVPGTNSGDATDLFQAETVARRSPVSIGPCASTTTPSSLVRIAK